MEGFKFNHLDTKLMIQQGKFYAIALGLNPDTINTIHDAEKIFTGIAQNCEFNGTTE